MLAQHLGHWKSSRNDKVIYKNRYWEVLQTVVLELWSSRSLHHIDHRLTASMKSRYRHEVSSSLTPSNQSNPSWQYMQTCSLFLFSHFNTKEFESSSCSSSCEDVKLRGRLIAAAAKTRVTTVTHRVRVDVLSCIGLQLSRGARPPTWVAFYMRITITSLRDVSH